MKIPLTIILIGLFIFSCKKEKPELPHVNGIIQDIDGNSYNYAKILDDIWMTQGLKTSRFRNGDTIFHAQTNQDWYNSLIFEIPAWCYVNNDSVLSERYGKIYNLYAVNDARGLAPEGWHISTRNEWQKFVDFYGDQWNVGKHLKANCSDWINNGMGINDTKFTALPGGIRIITGTTIGLGTFSWHWTSTPSGSYSNHAALLPGINSLLNITTRDYSDGLYVRCVRD